MVEDRGPQVTAVAAFFLAISWIFVFLRGYTRIVVSKAFGVDDYLALVAQIFFTFFCSFCIIGVAHGTGKHAWDIQPQSEIPIGLKWWWTCELIYVLANLFMKLSVGLFLLRIAVYKSQRIALWVVNIVTVIISIYFFLLFVFQCWPVSYFWGQFQGMEGRCLSTKIITDSTYAYSVISCWADWTFCILPVAMVWKLQLNVRTKFSVILILGLCTIASIMTIIRIPYLETLKNTSDFLYATTDIAIYSVSETGLAITASCAATLRPLFRNFFSSTNSNRSRDTDGPWPTSSNPSRAGYLKSALNGTAASQDAEFGYGNKGGLSLTTIVATKKPTGTPNSEVVDDVEMGSQSSLVQQHPYMAQWDSGIRKTTEVSTERTEGRKG